MAAALQHRSRARELVQRGLVALAIVALAPSVSDACPACAADNRDGAVLAIVGVFLLVPFALATLVWLGLRRLPLAPGDRP